MADNARCECGSRIFFNKQTLITTASGTIRDIPSVLILECVRCSRRYSVTTDAGKKELAPFSTGAEAEKLLFKEALKSWRNIDRPESNESHVVLEDADKADFARLGL